MKTNKEILIPFNQNNFFNNNIIGWSLTVSNIINTKNDICFVAVSCITDKDTNPIEIEKVSSQRAYIKIILNLKARGDSRILFILLLSLYCYSVHTFTHIYTFILNLTMF